MSTTVHILGDRGNEPAWIALYPHACASKTGFLRHVGLTCRSVRHECKSKGPPVVQDGRPLAPEPTRNRQPSALQSIVNVADGTLSGQHGDGE